MHKLLLIFTLSTAPLFSAAHEPKELFSLIQRGDIKGTQDFLNAHPESLETKNGLGQTPLCIALIHLRTLIIRELIEKRKADVNALDNEKNSMFYHAILSDPYLRKEYCLLLLNHGHDPLYCSPENTTLLTAAQYNAPEIIEDLLDRGVRVNLQNANGVTALEIAAGNNSTAVAKILLEHGADMSLHSGLGMGPIGWAHFYRKKNNRPELLHILTHTTPKFEHILHTNPVQYLQDRETGTERRNRRRPT